jgi:hypothetical protein
MKKQINVFDSLIRLKIIVNRYLSLDNIEISFRDDNKFKQSIVLFIFYTHENTSNQLLRIDFDEIELKYGTDLIYSRTEKKCIQKAIELKIYNPPILVM